MTLHRFCAQVLLKLSLGPVALFRASRWSLYSVWFLLCLSMLVPTSAALAAKAEPNQGGEQGVSIDPLLTDPKAALEFDYCQWRFEKKGTQESLPDLESLMDESSDATSLERLAASQVLAGTRIALAAKNRKSCSKIFVNGQEALDQALDKATKKMPGKGFMLYSKDSSIAEVQKKIVALWVRDQAARQVYIESTTDDLEGAAYWRRRLAIAAASQADDDSTAALEELLETIDWFDIPTYGEEVSAHAWILAQHADDRPDFQKLVLSRMEKYLESGGVSRKNYAYLWDRVAVNHGELQRYGTQPDWNCKDDGSLEFQPMEEPSEVDERRKSMGIGPAQAELEAMARNVCR